MTPDERRLLGRCRIKILPAALLLQAPLSQSEVSFLAHASRLRAPISKRSRIASDACMPSVMLRPVDKESAKGMQIQPLSRLKATAKRCLIRSQLQPPLNPKISMGCNHHREMQVRTVVLSCIHLQANPACTHTMPCTPCHCMHMAPCVCTAMHDSIRAHAHIHLSQGNPDNAQKRRVS